MERERKRIKTNLRRGYGLFKDLEITHNKILGIIQILNTNNVKKIPKRDLINWFEDQLLSLDICVRMILADILLK